MNTGVVLPYETAAMRGDELPKDLPMPDQLLYIGLRSLYWQVRKDIITRDTAVVEKRRLLEQYRINTFRFDMWQNAARREQEIESLLAAIRKDSDLMQNDKVNALVSAIDGIRR
ncbi:MAG: hypothetical protein IJJ99_02965 [Oscillospiraceae bacterium]|nr:hypothetical protein [Oscillospiraceae bacterium]